MNKKQVLKIPDPGTIVSGPQDHMISLKEFLCISVWKHCTTASDKLPKIQFEYGFVLYWQCDLQKPA